MWGCLPIRSYRPLLIVWIAQHPVVTKKGGEGGGGEGVGEGGRVRGRERKREWKKERKYKE